jgi:hypothetical protein
MRSTPFLLAALLALPACFDKDDTGLLYEDSGGSNGGAGYLVYGESP